MKKIITFISLSLLSLSIKAQSLPEVVSGKIERITQFQSKYVTARNIDIWLPEGYSPTKKYSVLYMNDGQMLFDANMTWNKQSWDVDDVVTPLLKENKIQDLIVVGIWNDSNTRHIDYFPQKPFESLTQQQQDSIYNSNRTNGQKVFNGKTINSDNYLKFLVEEIRPIINKSYSVYKDVKHTFIAGSSMGGLISLYAICEYPKIFGGAACLSTHWPGIFTVENNPIPNAFFSYLKTHLPNPKSNKIYFDYGTDTLDALYKSLQPKVDEIMISKGFSKTNWITKKFEGDDHSENSWKRRFDVPLRFLMRK
ncbi:alpha/beta hydrolase [Flavobacterium aciduliphilum]|uniref:Putative esterase n=1 Tax=Flavobacterium aciduliphilum TaxID=1101402 RepID=A0A328YC17_9FLAO|nr:alpha/beta hydrolase-fold protein [Flavobacterium aciduliphilum]RAR70653.1 putative esterase [Flavobacterium aciduliphilum]